MSNTTTSTSSRTRPAARFKPRTVAVSDEEARRFGDCSCSTLSGTHMRGHCEDQRAGR